jgi:hypothetical protein
VIYCHICLLTKHRPQWEDLTCIDHRSGPLFNSKLFRLPTYPQGFISCDFQGLIFYVTDISCMPLKCKVCLFDRPPCGACWASFWVDRKNDCEREAMRGLARCDGNGKLCVYLNFVTKTTSPSTKTTLLIVAQSTCSMSRSKKRLWARSDAWTCTLRW